VCLAAHPSFLFGLRRMITAHILLADCSGDETSYSVFFGMAVCYYFGDL
jgi:hypothetical protein